MDCVGTQRVILGEKEAYLHVCVALTYLLFILLLIREHRMGMRNDSLCIKLQGLIIPESLIFK